MWIRSQERISLINVNEVYIFPIDETINIVRSNNYTLGTYSSFEKAKKVLDKIEKYLNSNSKIIEKSRDDYYISDINLKVFQMPKDSEVEDDD